MPGINPANVVYDFFSIPSRGDASTINVLLARLILVRRSKHLYITSRVESQKRKSYTTFAGLIPGMEKKKFVHVITITKNNIVPNLAL
jgi:hypothetical protein